MATKITVLGTGSWGTTLAILQARLGREVTLLARDAAEAERLRAAGENVRFLPGIAFPEGLRVEHDPEAGPAGCELLLLVVPAQTMRANVAALRPYLPEDAGAGPLLVSCAKGLELGSLQRMSEVIRSELSPGYRSRVLSLSGPNIAKEVAAGLPAVAVGATEDMEVAQAAQVALTGGHFRVYTNSDLIGVELAGALKNIIALGAGIADGMGAGDNTKAAFITRGLAEIARLGVAAGANLYTFAGLAGVGDLIATCASPFSRNRRLGEALVQGKTVEEFERETGQVAEGVPTTQAARALAALHGVDMPITDEMYHILFEGKHPLAALASLMERDPTDELRGMGVG
ncbi:MAG: NAD(P)H-dependent glycerol-3-phosphate dehydrogenase [Chloroflexia bacterium]